jgi:hypothetical protein
VVYLIFDEGYIASSGATLIREDRCKEAIRLGRLLAELMPDEAEVLGLLALMLLIESRRPAPTAADGALVQLADRDRREWNQAAILEGQRLVRRCLRRNQPGPYQIQAAINAVHSDAPSAEATDWRQIVELYDLLVEVVPTRVAALNRAVAVAEVDGPEEALTLVEDLALDRSTCSTRSGPTFSAASAARQKPPKPTSGRLKRPRTQPSGTSSPEGSNRSADPSRRLLRSPRREGDGGSRDRGVLQDRPDRSRPELQRRHRGHRHQ